ncbi:mechanosensitive ion channel family protein [Flavihumibacter profundi]|uniref:mechanosensitive ion channel family protein n=1 Tax=Flavihumibacter profundi TaxID=2716883 RepID=UPI001CC45E52|nr:mechanosensitive ion channel domain-containing protein [Flavihumibacter profundi]MBZ5856355.1 mechanosensitive ion channel [Flavihumibacter profundi]
MRYRIFLAFFSLIVGFAPVFGQEIPDSLFKKADQDTITPLLQKTALNPFTDTDTLSGKFFQDMEDLTRALNKVNSFLKRGLDTLEIHDYLPEVSRMIENVKGSLFSSDLPVTQRSLSTSRVILLQYASRLAVWQKTLEKYNANLQDLREEILAIIERKEFGDTSLLRVYNVQLKDLWMKWNKMKVDYESRNKNIAVLLQKVATASITTTDLLDEVSSRSKILRRSLLSKTDPFIWEPHPVVIGGFLNSFSKSTFLGWRLFRFYFVNHWSNILLYLVIALAFFLRVQYKKKQISNTNKPELLTPVKYLSRNAVLCSALLAFTIIPFISFSPPAVYIELFWFAMLLVATRLAWPDWSGIYHKNWWGIVGLFFLFGYDNLLTRVSTFERWSILGFTIIAVLLGLKLLREVRENPSRYPEFQREVIWLFVIANLVSVLLNIFGRFTLAKLISNTAVIGLAHALSFFLLVEIMVEAVYLVLEGNKKSRIASYFQFAAIKDKFRKVLIFIGVLLWVIAFLWSLNLIDIFTDDLKEFLTQERSIGSVQFTLGSILVFLAVLWISFTVSNMLRFFFGGKTQVMGGENRNKMGSWILLVRLVIISIGFLLAMGAAGIPLDKLAIVIGALGVGIGFGLQNIVNNLVSGIILAFEKPMDVGDVIEIGPNTGRVKEIGIRSSKISTFDGADIIVPNGDFISQRLINWTHNNNYRRIEIVVSVAYGTNLEKAQQIVQKLLDGDTKIAYQPAPTILWNDLGNNSVNMRVLFWTSDFDNWTSLKSEVLKNIYNQFITEGISMPFPQQDLHIKSIHPDILNQLNKKDTPA